MEEILECLDKANAQIEMARIYYMKNKDNAVFETEFGNKFKRHLAETIKNGSLAHLCLCIVMLEEMTKENEIH